MRFRTTVELHGRTATGMAVPPDAVEALPYSHKQRHVLAIDDAKTPETRAQRIDKALGMLRAGGR